VPSLNGGGDGKPYGPGNLYMPLLMCAPIASYFVSCVSPILQG
jgi:hypothetical protein